MEATSDVRQRMVCAIVLAGEAPWMGSFSCEGLKVAGTEAGASESQKYGTPHGPLQLAPTRLVKMRRGLFGLRFVASCAASASPLRQRSPSPTPCLSTLRIKRRSTGVTAPCFLCRYRKPARHPCPPRCAWCISRRISRPPALALFARYRCNTRRSKSCAYAPMTCANSQSFS